jgi:hypothetical protein
MNPSPSDLALLLRLERTARFFIGALTVAVSIYAYIGIRTVFAVEHGNSSNGEFLAAAYALCAGVVNFSFWNSAIEIATAPGGRWRRKILPAVCLFLLLAVPAIAWPGAAAIAGSQAMSLGMNESAIDATRRLDSAFVRAASANAISDEIYDVATRLNQPGITEQDAQAYRTLAKLHAWMNETRDVSVGLYRDGMGGLERMREIANSPLSRRDAIDEFLLVADEVDSKIIDLASTYPGPAMVEVSTDLSRIARDMGPASQEILAIASGIGRLGSMLADAEPMASKPFGSPMMAVASQWSAFPLAWAASIGLLCLPFAAVTGLGSMHALASQSGSRVRAHERSSQPAGKVLGRAGTYRTAILLATGVVAIGIAGNVRTGIEAALPLPSLDLPTLPITHSEPQVRRYDPSDGAGTNGPVMPGVGPVLDPGEMSRPMHFVDAGDGVVSAIGKVVDGTPGTFATFVEELGHPVQVIALNSPGGSVEGAMAFSRQIRGLGISTYVPEGGYCASACPMILAGGKTRSFGKGATVGIHQVYAPNAANPTIETLASSIAEVQRTVARVQSLLEEMGVSSSIWQKALVTGPGELYVLTPEELASSNLASIRTESTQAVR